jgi:hypothetical protein
MLNHLKHIKISFIQFPGSSFLSLGHHVWTNVHLMKDCSHVTFPIMLDMAPYSFLTKNWCPYQLPAGISHPSVLRAIKVIP